MSKIMKVTVITVVLVLGTTLSVTPVHAFEPDDIVIEGQVVNGTWGGDDVAGIPVALHRVASPGDVHSRDVVTDQSGSFRFDDVSYHPDSFYAVAVDYMGALYVETIDLSGSSIAPVKVTIYDAVDDDAVISATSVEVLFSTIGSDSQAVWAWEIVELKNDTNTTYVPGKGPMSLLGFGLPDGYSGLYVDTDLTGDVIQVDRGFRLTASVSPGTHWVMYSYAFPYSGDSVSFNRSLTYGADVVMVRTVPELATLSIESIGSAKFVDIGERGYQVLSGVDLGRGSSIVIVLEGLPKVTVASRAANLLEHSRLEYVALVGLVGLMVSIVMVSMWRRGNTRSLLDSRGSKESVQSSEREGLVIQIAGLVESFENGDITEVQYRSRREILTKRLLGVTQNNLGR